VCLTERQRQTHRTRVIGEGSSTSRTEDMNR